jgi:hypothetical protein
VENDDITAGLKTKLTRLSEIPGASPSFPMEPFVDASTVSAFLSVPRPDVLRMTRERRIRGYPYKGRLRHVYRYRLSEVSEDFAALLHPAEVQSRKQPL